VRRLSEDVFEVFLLALTVKDSDKAEREKLLHFCAEVHYAAVPNNRLRRILAVPNIGTPPDSLEN
jgi:hypothetical protein